VAETPPAPVDSTPVDSKIPPPPSADEQKKQADAYQKSSQDMDRRIERIEKRLSLIEA